MKPLITILLLFFLVACTTNTDITKTSIHNFDTLRLPDDSLSFYFETKPSWQDTTANALDTFVNSWYSKMLFALKEPVLKNYNGDKEIYRFTWLRTFNHPVSIRLEKQNDVVKLFSKVCSGAGGYDPGKIIFDSTLALTTKDVDAITTKLANANFWSLQTEKRNGDGLDGSEWIIEVYKDNKYHMVVRWTPENNTSFREIGEYLISISEIKNETEKDDFY